MSSTPIRQQVFASARSVVIKMGTQLLTGKGGQLDPEFFKVIASQIVAIRAQGVAVTLVSSGAVGSGLAQLELPRRPRDIAQLQAVAAVGQPRLMSHLHEAFAPYDLEVAQLLLTRSDFDDRIRFLNLRNCVTQLQDLGCLPVINENDTVAVDELRVGDNDQLAALMCNALSAQVLVLLTVVDGLLDAQGKRVDCVEDVEQIRSLARKDKSKLGTGGMTSKLEAARIVAQAGEMTVIANGREPDVLLKLFRGDPVGTVFLPKKQPKLDSRARWIGLTRRPAGALAIDAGAIEALVRRGKSLLASGISSVAGDFPRGAVVAVTDVQGAELARGLTNYSADELQLIKGRHSREFEKILGRTAYGEVIHCDNLVVTQR